MSDSKPFGAFSATPQPRTIDDGHEDIARRFSGEKLRVDASNRRTFLKCFLRTYGGKNTKESYDVESHGPGIHPNPDAKLPLETELVQDEQTREFLEVGLILAEDPELYLKVTKHGISRDSAAEKARAERILERSQHLVLRAYIEVTEIRPVQAEFFVGCLFRDGHYELKRGKREWVFFYQEFQPCPDVKPSGKSEKPLNQVERKSAIIHNAKVAASVRPALHTTRSSIMMNKIATANQLHVTPRSSLYTQLNILLAIFENKGSEDILDAIIDVLESMGLDLTDDATLENKGIRAFTSFKDQFTLELSHALEKEIQVRNQ